MKSLMTTAALIAGLAALPVAADVYVDATGDLHDGTGGGDDFSGFSHLDISQVEVTSTTSTITFAITTVGDITLTTWGKYVIGIDSTAGGDAAGNGWGRPISISSGMDAWVGSWADGAPSERQAFTWNGASWDMNNQSPVDGISGNTTTFSIALADLGLSAGQTIQFDVYATAGGGGDSAVDALGLGTPSITTWGGAYDSGANTLSYTIVPEPGSLALIGLGALAVVRRRR